MEEIPTPIPIPYMEDPDFEKSDIVPVAIFVLEAACAAVEEMVEMQSRFGVLEEIL